MIRLSPTAVLKYENCPYQYYLEEVRRIRPIHKAANLAFGIVIHRTLEAWLRDNLLGASTDPLLRFEQHWEAVRNAGGVEYSATQSPESLTATGRALVAGFAAAWPTFGRLLAVSADGIPLLECKLEVPIASQVLYVGKTDLLAFNADDGGLECLDMKTPSTPTDPDWLIQADQMIGYQILLDENAERLGLPPVERLGLLELVKRKVPTRTGKGPEVCAPMTVVRYSSSTVDDYRYKLRWVAEDIQRGRFPKRSLMAHHSPCEMCAMKNLCRFGDPEGLVIPTASAAA